MQVLVYNSRRQLVRSHGTHAGARWFERDSSTFNVPPRVITSSFHRLFPHAEEGGSGNSTSPKVRLIMSIACSIQLLV
jgi:hypothetical protein